MKESDDKLAKAFGNQLENNKKEWHEWKPTMIQNIVHRHTHNQRIDSNIRKGIENLKKLEVVLKQADKNLGLVPIRGDIYCAMLRKHLATPSYKKLPNFHTIKY